MGGGLGPVDGQEVDAGTNWGASLLSAAEHGRGPLFRRVLCQEVFRGGEVMANEMNRRRAAWAEIALDAFTAAKAEKLPLDREEFETAIGDLITDLLHLARKRHISAGQLYAHAMRMFNGEVQDKE